MKGFKERWKRGVSENVGKDDGYGSQENEKGAEKRAAEKNEKRRNE